MEEQNNIRCRVCFRPPLTYFSTTPDVLFALMSRLKLKEERTEQNNNRERFVPFALELKLKSNPRRSSGGIFSRFCDVVYQNKREEGDLVFGDTSNGEREEEENIIASAGKRCWVGHREKNVDSQDGKTKNKTHHTFTV